MAADSYGPKKQPRFAGAGVPQDAADLTTVSDFAALVGNRKAGPTGDRNTALSNGEVWEGLIWGDTTDGNEYRMTSGAWVLLLPQIRDSFSQSGQKNAGVGAGATYNFEGGSFLIPTGRAATIRASLYCLVGRQATTGTAAGTMSLVVGTNSRPEGVGFNSQAAGTNVPLTLAESFAFQVIGTGVALPLNVRIGTASASAAITVWDYRHNFTLEY